MTDELENMTEADKEVIRRFNSPYRRFKNKLEYVELYTEDLILLKRRRINVRVLGLLLFHYYLHNCDGDVILLMEINELERKLAKLDLTPFVKNEITRMLYEKKRDYASSQRAKDFLTGLIEFEQAIETYKEVPEILRHAEQLINKIQKYNNQFDPLKYIENYNFRKTCPKNPFVVDDFKALSNTPRKRLKAPKKKKPSLYDASKYEIQT